MTMREALVGRSQPARGRSGRRLAAAVMGRGIDGTLATDRAAYRCVEALATEPPAYSPFQIL